jgi:CxxC motif-containing protein (DUF1111 family)
VLAWLVAGCRPGSSAADSSGEPGTPLAGLSAREIDRFTAGQALFTHTFTPAEGLGPLFNETRCSNCHDLPAAGGTGAELVTKATRFAAGRCDQLESAGGDNVQKHATPLLQAAGVMREEIPAGATAAASIVPPALYGLGLLEAVPDSAILSRERAAGRDGVAGRAARTPDHRVGRFGRKAEFATLREFIEGALLQEIGITSPHQPREVQINGRPLPAGTDPVGDPEASQETVDVITDFVRLLAPPAPEHATGAALDSVSRGERLFAGIGCAACHVPTLATADSGASALAHRTVNAYTDLLLHDVGPLLATICSADAPPGVWRTAPLMGVRLRKALLHDGRALSIDGAVRMHGGEALVARQAYERLAPDQRALLLRFVGSR